MCDFEGCERKVHARGYCVQHYRQLRTGKGLRRIGPEDPVTRFWKKVRKTPGCWEWTGARVHRDERGHGIFNKGKGDLILAHRFSYELACGPIPEGMQIDHMCRNRICVNPDHLQVVTPGLNAQNRSGAQPNSVSGVRGVHKGKRGKWNVRVQVDGQVHCGGAYSTIEEAARAARSLRNLVMTNSLADRDPTHAEAFAAALEHAKEDQP